MNTYVRSRCQGEATAPLIRVGYPRENATAQRRGNELVEPGQRATTLGSSAARCFTKETLKRAAVAGLGILSLPGYVCREEVRSGALRRVLPSWRAEDSTLTALMPTRQGILPSVRAFVQHLAAELPKVVAR